MKHFLNSNEVDFVFCGAGGFITLDIPDQSYSTYTEFYDNTLTNIFALRGGVLDAQVAKQTDQQNFAVFNMTSETIQRVQNGVYLIEGYNYETYALIQSVTVTDSFGNEDYAGFLQ